MKSAMKKSMKKAKRVSVIARGKRAKAAVFNGRKQKTASGISKGDLMKNKTGKIVSKKASAPSKKMFAGSKLKAWADAVKKARKQMGIKGFVPIGGKSTQGRALLAKVKKARKQMGIKGFVPIGGKSTQ